MQSWFSSGCMAPSLCGMLVSFKSKKLSHVNKKKSKHRERGNASVADAWNVDEPRKMEHGEDVESLPTVCPQLPRLSQRGSPPRTSIVGRNSDVMAGFPRFSTSSSSCYERLSVEYPGEGQNVPQLMKLGMASDRLARQDSSLLMGQRRDSSCSVTSFVSATSSRLIGAYAYQRDASKIQPHIGELFSGNQLFMHVTAVPPVFALPCVHAELNPSSGFLNASVRCRDADLQDRIILFR